MRHRIGRLIVRVLLIVLSALTGFVGGGWLAIRQRRDALLAAFPSAPATSRPRTIVGKQGPFGSEEEAFSAIFSAHREEDRLRRGFELSEALERLDAAQCAGFVARVAKLRREEHENLLGPLLARWSELDPEAAQSWAQPFIDRAFAGRRWDLDEAVLIAWAKADPERALAEALKSPERVASLRLAISAADALAGENPAEQIARLAALPAGRLREQALAEGLKEWAKKDAASAYAQLARLAPGPDFERTRSEILTGWAGKDPAAALAQLRALLPDLPPGWSGSALINRVVINAGRKDAHLALAWVEDLPPSFRSDATTAALLAWAPKEPIAALDWARTHGVPLDARIQSAWVQNYDSQFGNGLLKAAMGEADSEKIFDWLRKLPADEGRGRLLAEAIRAQPNETARALFGELPPAEQIFTVSALGFSFGRDNPEASVQWAQSLPRGAVREQAVMAVVTATSRRFPDGMESLIEKFASGSDRDAALRGYASAQYQDPMKGLEIAGRIGDRGVRELAFRSIVNSWLFRDTSAAETWLASTSELTPETKATLLRNYQDWRSEDRN